MVVNRSAMPSTVVPVVAYPDVDEAVRWLAAAFGFRVRLRIGSHRVQMWFGDACVVVGEQGEAKQWATKSSTPLRLENVDTAFARAVEQGAQVIHVPETKVYGERQATLVDFAGHIWTLTQTVTDVDPASWGGTAVEV